MENQNLEQSTTFKAKIIVLIIVKQNFQNPKNIQEHYITKNHFSLNITIKRRLNITIHLHFVPSYKHNLIEMSLKLFSQEIASKIDSICH